MIRLYFCNWPHTIGSMKLEKGPRTFVCKVAHLCRVYRIVSWYSIFRGMELRSPRERNYHKSSNNPWRLLYIVFLKLKLDLPTKLFSKHVVWNFRFQANSYALYTNIRRTCWVRSYSIHLRIPCFRLWEQRRITLLTRWIRRRHRIRSPGFIRRSWRHRLRNCLRTWQRRGVDGGGSVE